jgi:dTDP-4-amino-4,6-dideoxygalactose transaminase
MAEYQEVSNSLALLIPDFPSLQQITPYFAQVLDSGRYSNFGPLVLALEDRIAQTIYRGQPDPVHCVTTSSGTTAIEIALQALRLPAGAQVLMPGLGFPAAAQAVARLGYRPLFAGVDRRCWSMIPADAAAILRQTPVAAVIPVSLFGYAEDAAGWSGFATEHGVAVIIDAAAGLGNQIVSPGTMVVTSMHATKALGIGEGGLLATTDAEMAERLRALTNFGFENRIATQIGGNAKLSEWHAAVAHAQLDRWDDICTRRAAVRDRYRRYLDVDGWPLGLHPDTWSVPVPGFMPVKMRSGRAALRLVEALEAQNIASRRWVWPALSEHPAFAATQMCEVAGNSAADCSELAASLVCLPFHTGLDDADVERVAAAVCKEIDKHRD